MKIRAARLKTGLSQKGMSDLLDIPLRTIEDWETGKRTPPPYVEKLVIKELNQISNEKSMNNYKDYLNEQLKNEEFKKEWDALEPEFHIIQAMIDARKKSGMTQKELALRTGIAQADISKLENGNANPSLKTLQRLAEGMDMRIKIEFCPISES